MDDGFNRQSADKQVVKSTGATVAAIVKTSIPPIVANIFFFLIQLTILYAIGQNCEQEYLAGVGTGNMLINVICMAICQGFNGTLETFVSQNFGSGKTTMCGIQFNRARFILTILFVPIVLIFYFVDDLLVLCA